MSEGIKGVECADCNKRMFSFSTHDYKTCGCPNNTVVDGGRSYLRCGWKTNRPKDIFWTEELDGKYPIVKDTTKWPY